MKREFPEVIAARNLAAQTEAKLRQSPAFQQLNPHAQTALLRDLSTIRQAFDPKAAAPTPAARDPYALTLETPEDFARRRSQARFAEQEKPANGNGEETASEPGAMPKPRSAATETLASRAGALSDEIDFPAFVAGLIHGTFDAIVDAAIRQMEAFANLVSAVAKNVEDFTRDNVTANQARDWLVQQYPKDLELTFEENRPRLRRRARGAEDEEQPAPEWLADFDLADEELTDELIEEQLIPVARRRVGESRLQMLATMVLLGMNRVIVKDGTISARLRFRAAARDKAAVDYAVSQDPGGSSWGTRGSMTYPQHTMMVSTVGVNVQADTELRAELFGEVKINFASETVPLERFVDQARLALVQRHTRTVLNQTGASKNVEPAASAISPAPGAVAAPTPPANAGVK